MPKNKSALKINVVAVGKYGCNVVKRLGNLGKKEYQICISVSDLSLII
jgi:cell division GTPase FtsZ